MFAVFKTLSDAIMMRSRKDRRCFTRRRELSAEILESRLLLAGHSEAPLIKVGPVVTIRGDDNANEVIVEDRGHGTIEFSYETPETGEHFTGVINGVEAIELELRGGSDSFEFSSRNVPEPLTTITGSMGLGDTDTDTFTYTITDGATSTIDDGLDLRTHSLQLEVGAAELLYLKIDLPGSVSDDPEPDTPRTWSVLLLPCLEFVSSEFTGRLALDVSPVDSPRTNAEHAAHTASIRLENVRLSGSMNLELAHVPNLVRAIDGLEIPDGGSYRESIQGTPDADDFLLTADGVRFGADSAWLTTIESGAGDDRVIIANRGESPAEGNGRPVPRPTTDTSSKTYRIDLGSGNDFAYIGDYAVWRENLGTFYQIGGGLGNDTVVVAMALAARTTGPVIVSISGDEGDDTLIGLVVGSRRHFRSSFVIDGGPGRDGCLATPNFDVLNCEDSLSRRALFADSAFLDAVDFQNMFLAKLPLVP